MPKNATTSFYRGIQGEAIAVAFLHLHGYHILEKRYRTPFGEIDIIARYENMIVCVEVKARSSLNNSLKALHTHQQERIIKAYLYFIQSFPDYSNKAVRFDVIVCAPSSKPLHIENAFEANYE
jgi:putative endonuclease